jgi:RNA polymerase sigma factor (sigma-70 family)
MNNMEPENINLIKKIAWSFHNSTGADWEDLFQEAALAYYQALERYKPEQGKLTTFMWWCIHSHLKTYIKKEKKYSEEFTVDIDSVKIHKVYTTTPIEHSLTDDAQEIVDFILRIPEFFDVRAAGKHRKHIAEVYINKRGWTKKRVDTAFENLRLAFS